MAASASENGKIMMKISEKNVGIEVGQTELGQLLFSHRDSVVYRIRRITKDALARLAKGEYDSTIFFNQISEEIKKSRELFRGFTDKKSGRDICELIEANFSQKELKAIFDKMEVNFILSEDSAERKFLTLTGYIEVTTDEIFSKLIHGLRGLK